MNYTDTPIDNNIYWENGMWTSQLTMQW